MHNFKTVVKISNCQGWPGQAGKDKHVEYTFRVFNKSAGHLNVLYSMFLVPSKVHYNKDLLDQPFFRIKFLYTNDKYTA